MSLAEHFAPVHRLWLNTRRESHCCWANGMALLATIQLDVKSLASAKIGAWSDALLRMTTLEPVRTDRPKYVGRPAWLTLGANTLFSITTSDGGPATVFCRWKSKMSQLRNVELRSVNVTTSETCRHSMCTLGSVAFQSWKATPSKRTVWGTTPFIAWTSGW